MKTYTYFYKFAQEKMRSFVDDPLIMLFTLQYLKDTRFNRAHTRETLSKNSDAYYRAIENMINISKHSKICYKVIPIILSEQEYTLTNIIGQESLSIKNL